jgi:hypothetical protein
VIHQRFCLCLALLTLLSVNTFAQKVKAETISATIKHYPIIALPDEFKTYSVSFDDIAFDSREFKKVSQPSERIQFKAFQAVNGPADLNIKISLGRVTFKDAISNKTIESLDALKGSSSTSIRYSIPFRYEVTDSRGIIIQKETLGSDGQFYQSNPPNNGATALAVGIVEAVNSAVNEAITKAAVRLKDLFDTYMEPYSTDLYYIKASKTDTYDGYSKAIKDLQSAYKTSGTDEEMIKPVVKKSIDFWETAATSIDQKNEDGKDHYFLCMFNLSVANALYDDFIKAAEYIEKTRATGVKPGYTGLMKGEVLKRKKYSDQYYAEKEKVAKDPTFIYQKGNAEIASPTSVFDLTKKNTAPATEFMEKGFVVLTSGDTLRGSFIEFDLNMKAGKIVFVPVGKSQQEYKKPFKDLSSMSVRGEVFYTLPNSLLKIVYRSASVVLLATSSEAHFIFPTNKKHVTYTFFTRDDAAAMMVNYKKKLAEVFKDVCAVVEENSRAGKYALKEEGVEALIPAVKDFENNCGSQAYDTHASAFEKESIKRLYK